MSSLPKNGFTLLVESVFGAEYTHFFWGVIYIMTEVKGSHHVTSFKSSYTARSHMGTEQKYYIVIIYI